MCENELKILQQREVNDLKAEIEVFKLREERNRRKVELQDDLVAIFVNNRVQNPYLKEEILRTWNKKNKDEMERVHNVWMNKMEGVKRGFIKDKEFIKRHNLNRVKPQNNEPSWRKMTPRSSVIERSEDPAGTRENMSSTSWRNMEPRSNTSERTEEHSASRENVTSPSSNENTERNQMTSVLEERDGVEEVEASEVCPFEISSEEELDRTVTRNRRSSNDSTNTLKEDPNEGNEEMTTQEICSTQTMNSSQPGIMLRSNELEEVESDENFSDDENSEILFDNTLYRKDAEDLAQMLSSTSDEDADDEINEDQQIFRRGYNLRMKQRKPRNSYSPQATTERRNAQRTSQHRKSSTSQVKTSHQHR